MENASKALIMAGSVLMAILVIGILVFGYNQISHVEQTKEDSEQIDKMTEYMMRFEQFNRGKDNALYGSELLSLANLQEDYNESEAREDVGYDKIDITVKINKTLENYLEEGSYDISKLLDVTASILDEIDKYENIKNPSCIKYNGKTVKYYSSKSYREIALEFTNKIKGELEDQYGVSEIPSNWGNDMISGFLYSHPTTKPLLDDITEYKNLKNTLYNEFRTGKKFYCSEVVYNKYNGRLKEMIFEEIT